MAPSGRLLCNRRRAAGRPADLKAQRNGPRPRWGSPHTLERVSGQGHMDHRCLFRDRACATAGARLILSARRADALEEVRRACGTAEVHLVPLDLADLDSLPGRATEALACYESVDIMVHNAGLAARARV